MGDQESWPRSDAVGSVGQRFLPAEEQRSSICVHRIFPLHVSTYSLRVPNGKSPGKTTQKTPVKNCEKADYSGAKSVSYPLAGTTRLAARNSGRRPRLQHATGRVRSSVHAYPRTTRRTRGHPLDQRPDSGASCCVQGRIAAGPRPQAVQRLQKLTNFKERKKNGYMPVQRLFPERKYLVEFIKFWQAVG